MLAALSVPNQVSQASPKRKLSSALPHHPPPSSSPKNSEAFLPIHETKAPFGGQRLSAAFRKISQWVLTSSCSIRVGKFGENARHGGGTMSHQIKPDLTLYYQNSICAGQVSRVLCGLLWFFK